MAPSKRKRALSFLKTAAIAVPSAMAMYWLKSNLKGNLKGVEVNKKFDTIKSIESERFMKHARDVSSPRVMHPLSVVRDQIRTGRRGIRYAGRGDYARVGIGAWLQREKELNDKLNRKPSLKIVMGKNF